MTVTLDQAKAECLSLSPLPDGYKIEVGNKRLLVYGKKLAFLLRQEEIDRGLHTTEYPIMLKSLVEHETLGSKPNPEGYLCYYTTKV